MNSQAIIINVFAMIKHQTYFAFPNSEGKIENRGTVLIRRKELSDSFMLSSFESLHNSY